MMAESSGESSASNNTLAYREDTRDVVFHAKHEIFLSHSGAQKDFVEQLCVDLERWDRHPFFDKRRDSLPIGENFPQHIFEAIRQCQVGVVILSEEFFTRSKWPMIELVAMVREAKSREVGFKIVPVFLGMSIDAFRDSEKRNGWRSCWHELALNDKRIDMEEWEGALKHLEPLNSMGYDGMGEVKFRREIVDVLCGAVCLETRLEDSHVQGRLRLCKVIQGRISRLEKERSQGVVVVGLYGMGGIGKTSICKALCNEYVTRFHGRVCHAELDRKNREELLREVLKRLTDTSRELLDRWNGDELLQKLNEGIIREPVFLVVDNVLDLQVSIDEAKCYVSTRLPSGSVVMLTSRSKETLKLVRRNLVDNNVMEMPELDVEEARSLFCKSYQMDARCEINDGVVKRCVERCYFKKGDGNGGYHYHPLSLDVLGKQLAYIDVEEWEAHLDRIDKDIFNQSGEVEHQVFSILRKSYDLLTVNDQLLFMDVALFVPQPRFKFAPFEGEYDANTYEWLGMVHSISVDDVVSRLKRLSRKSLLENLDDGIKRRIGMHDLWHTFCEVEVQSGELRCRRWMYGAKGNVELMERCPVGGCWENVARMAFCDLGKRGDLERVNFSYFPNVTVLNIGLHRVMKNPVLDLSRHGCLKSLDLTEYKLSKLFLHLPRCLVYLRLQSICNSSGPWDTLIKQVECLPKLQYLELIKYGGDKLPDMGTLVSLRMAIFYKCINVVTLTTLSTKFSKLRVLQFINCFKLRSCPGVGDLVELENLHFGGCHNLKRLPNLGNLRNLRKLLLHGCFLIKEVPGLGDLVALEELRMGDDRRYESEYNLYKGSKHLFSLDVSKLRNLRILHMRGCRLEALLGFDSLVSLEDVEVDFQEVVVKPSVRQLTKLQALRISHGWDLERLNELNNFVMLHDLKIEGCFGVDYLPHIQGLISLQTLLIRNCEFKGVGGMSKLIALETLEISSCKMLESLPNLQGLIRLKTLVVSGCEMLESLPNLQGLIRLKQLKIHWCKRLRRWDCRVGAVEGSSYPVGHDYVGSQVSTSRMLITLQTLEFLNCPVFEDVMVIGAFSNLQSLEFGYQHATIELPNLSYFPGLKKITLIYCKRLRRLTVREPIHALTKLILVGCCCGLMALPDLNNFPGLEELELHKCKKLRRLTTCEPIHALTKLKVSHCSSLMALPDLNNFPRLEHLELVGCKGLLRLSTSETLHSLQYLQVVNPLGNDCSLEELPDLGMFPTLKTLNLKGCTKLTSLRSSMPLPSLKRLCATGCTSLSGADLDGLQALCPQCHIRRDVNERRRPRLTSTSFQKLSELCIVL